MDRLFVYGTLQYPELLEHLLGRVPPHRAARLEGYARYTVRGADYPGIIPEEGARTDGLILSGIQTREWERLDQYEDDLYERRCVTPTLEDGGRITAFAYIIPDHNRHALSRQPWQKRQSKPRTTHG
ncbi:MAG: gamma-glutamylcyclotransferase [Verrucomicrobia bacterium]|nr:gamma-glutamylcyclotransferase [Verrucomicrobiota bacterium]MCH8527166.1 gamma-glutamylcyclotransferase [Kiritimatiellia bacterium]